jgi:hypothetical protein
MGVTSVCSLKAVESERLARSLHISAEAAARVSLQCRGIDGAAVVSTSIPKSITVTSWTTHTMLSDIAVKWHTGRSGPSVVVGAGGWVFEVHEGERRSNGTRCRWILLAMAIDLADKVIDTWLQWGGLPTKLTVGWDGCGSDHIPGPGAVSTSHVSSLQGPKKSPEKIFRN